MKNIDKDNSTFIKVQNLIKTLIDSKSGLTIEQLKDKFKISRSTIYNYIEQIEEKGPEYFGFENYIYIRDRFKDKGKRIAVHKIIEKSELINYYKLNRINNYILKYSIEYKLNFNKIIDYNSFIFDFTDWIYYLFMGAKIIENKYNNGNSFNYVKNHLKYYLIETNFCDFEIIFTKFIKNKLKIKLYFKWNKIKHKICNLIIRDSKLVRDIILTYIILINSVISEILGPVIMEDFLIYNKEKKTNFWRKKDSEIRKLIYNLIENQNGLRLIDIKNKMKLSRTSINDYLKLIQKNGLEYYGFYGYNYLKNEKKHNNIQYVYHIIKEKDPNIIDNKLKGKEIFYRIEYKILFKSAVDYDKFIKEFIYNWTYKTFETSKITNDTVVFLKNNETKKEISIDSELAYLVILLVYPKNHKDNWIDMDIMGYWAKNQHRNFRLIQKYKFLGINIVFLFFKLINKLISNINEIKEIKIIDTYFL